MEICRVKKNGENTFKNSAPIKTILITSNSFSRNHFQSNKFNFYPLN